MCLRQVGNVEHATRNVLRHREGGGHERLRRVQGGNSEAEVMGSSLHPEWSMKGGRGRRRRGVVMSSTALLLHNILEEIGEEG